MSDSDDDDIPRLSSHTLAALQEFYAEQKQQSDPGRDDKYNIGIIEENWQLSQFWYSQETAFHLAKEAIAAAGEHGRLLVRVTAWLGGHRAPGKLQRLCRQPHGL